MGKTLVFAVYDYDRFSKVCDDAFTPMITSL